MKHHKSHNRNDKGEEDNEDDDDDENYVAIEGSSIYPQCSGSNGHICDHDGDEICKWQYAIERGLPLCQLQQVRA